MRKITIQVQNMTCNNCKNKITKALKAKDGVRTVQVKIASQQVEIQYDEHVIREVQLYYALEKLGYPPVANANIQLKQKRKEVLEIFITILLVGFILQRFNVFTLFASTPIIEEGMSLLAILMVGLFTSFHCLGMCGGLALSGSATSKNPLKASVIYHSGRLMMYTIIGMLAGLIGSWFTLSESLQGMMYVIASMVMIYMGITQLQIFPNLPKIQLFHANPVYEPHNTFFKGMLNGLLPCGIMQMMQLYALTSGSWFMGGLSMLVFGLGTLPLLLGLGAMTKFLKKQFKDTFLQWSGALVIILGLFMAQSGLALQGIQLFDQKSDTAMVEDGIQVIEAKLEPRAYPSITLQEGIPVKLVIMVDEKDLNGCNYRMTIPEFKINHTFTVGENIIEFTPTKKGTFMMHCWMGMIRSTITIV